MKLFSHLNELIFPQRCLGCGVLGASLCLRCRVEWNPRARPIHFENLTVVASVEYSQVAQKVILAAKESRIKSADLIVRDAILYSYFQAIDILHIHSDAISLVPIPSQVAAIRKRGRDLNSQIASEIAEKVGVKFLPILRHRRKVRDQSTLNKVERWNNLNGSLVVDISDGARPPARVLLIDDLVTTGATLNEAARALRYAGFEVIGAVTAAIAKPLR